MRWCAPGFEDPLEELVAALVRTPWPGPPPGFTARVAPRPMRTVLQGRWLHGGESLEVVVKWQRPHRLADRISRRLRGGKGVREGRVLRRLEQAHVRTPRALAYEDERADVLVTAAMPGLQVLPPADQAPPPMVEAVARLLAQAHGAGLHHRDLHLGNLAWAQGAPVLVDLGSARAGAAPTEVDLVAELARAAHGLLHGARRTQRLRSLRAYLRAAGREAPRKDARQLARAIEEAARAVRRRHARGRDRRARRPGKHFELFSLAGGGRGVRRTAGTDTDWHERAAAWLASPPEDAQSLKSGGAVLRVGNTVLKYYGPVARGRLPRPLRALRCAYALRNRGVAAPAPRLAATRADGSGVYAAAYVEAPDLQRLMVRGGVDADLLRRLGRSLRIMHDAEVTHRDLKAPNLLVASDGSFPLVDLEGARIRRGRVGWVRRVRDLMRLDASLDLPSHVRRHLLCGYHDVLPRPPVSLERLHARVAALSAKKRGPTGRAR